MVAGLAFLSKKSFHTKNLDNQERVWIAEQKAAAEDQKTKELSRQIQQEREQEELQKLTGKKKGLDRGIDWMYEGGKALDNNDSQQEALAKDQEDYLLGKEYTGDKGADSGPGSKVTVAGDFVQALSSGGPGRSVNAVLESTAVALSEDAVPLAFVDKNEEFRLRHEDPMYMIERKRLEQSADASKKKALFDRVMGNGMGRPVKKRDHSSDDNDDDDDKEVGRRSRDKDRSSRKRERKEERKRERKSRHHRDRDDRHRRSHSHDRDDERHSRKRHRHHRKEREFSRSRSRGRYDRDDDGRDHHRHASQSRSRSRDRDREYSRKKQGSSRDDRGRRSRSFSPTDDRGYQDRQRHHHHGREDRKDPPTPQKNSTERPAGYGLVGGKSSNGKVTTGELGPDRALLAKKRQQEQDALQNARRRKDQRRPMTDKEKAEALRAMQQDATTRDNHRISQITKGKQENGNNDDDKIGPGEASFLRDISARTHGLHASDMTSMATRVARNRHTNQRTDDAFL